MHEAAGGIREPVGVPAGSIDATLKDMLNKCKLIRPDYMPIVDVAEYNQEHFVIAWCSGGSVRPYSAPKTMARGSHDRACYIRKMASTIEPSQEELRELYNLSNNVPFDDRPNHGASIDDLSISLIKEFLRTIGSALYDEVDTAPFVELCRRMDIVAGPDEYVRPKNVGLLFFSPDPSKFFPCAQIDVVEFPDGLGGERIIESTFTGPLDHQLRSALQYLQNTVLRELVVKKDDRPEAERFFNYPFAALEEALSNAVYHKGYDVREPIEVRVLPDKIEILSYPGADRSISIEGLRTYRAISRRYRNRRVGDFLKELHLTEGRNTGMAKILRAMRRNGSPDPLFETDEERLYFLTTLPVHKGFAPREAASSAPARPADEDTGSLLAGKEALLDFFEQHPTATLAQAAGELGVASSSVSRYVAELKRDGRLRREGSPRTGRWVIER